MIDPTIVPSRPLLPHCQLSSFFFTVVPPRFHPSTRSLQSRKNFYPSTTTTDGILTLLFPPRGWINCCVFDIHSLSGPSRRRRDERIKGKVTERLIFGSASSFARIFARICAHPRISFFCSMSLLEIHPPFRQTNLLLFRLCFRAN